MGGKTQTTQQVSNNEPWSGAQENLKFGMTEGKKLYDEGSKIYEGDTFTPISADRMIGINQLNHTAQQSKPHFADAFGAMSNLTQDGFNDPQRNSIANLSNVANGGDMGGSNPHFQSILKQAQDDTSNAVNMSASANGRYGSGAHQGVMADRIGNMTSNMLSQEYNNQQGRMDNANSQLFQAGQAGVGNQMAANSSLGEAYQNSLNPANASMQIGNMFEEQDRFKLTDDLRRFNEGQNKGWDDLSRLMAVTSGAGQYGTSTTTAQQPGQSPIATGLGGLSMLAGLGGGFF